MDFVRPLILDTVTSFHPINVPRYRVITDRGSLPPSSAGPVAESRVDAGRQREPSTEDWLPVLRRTGEKVRNPETAVRIEPPLVPCYITPICTRRDIDSLRKNIHLFVRSQNITRILVPNGVMDVRDVRERERDETERGDGEGRRRGEKKVRMGERNVQMGERNVRIGERNVR